MNVKLTLFRLPPAARMTEEALAPLVGAPVPNVDTGEVLGKVTRVWLNGDDGRSVMAEVELVSGEAAAMVEDATVRQLAHDVFKTIRIV